MNKICGVIYVSSNWMLSDKEIINDALSKKLKIIFELMNKSLKYCELYYDICWLNHTIMSHAINVYGYVPGDEADQLLKILIDEYMVDDNFIVDTYCFNIN